MWEEDSTSGYEPDEDAQPNERPPWLRTPAPASSFPQALPLPNLVGLSALYEAARARAEADQQLSKLFNPEYYI